MTLLRRWGVLTLIALASVLAVLRAIPAAPKEPGGFVLWLANYRYGLVKRGLIGEFLLRFVFPEASRISSAQMFAVTTALSLLAFAAFALLGARAWWRMRHSDSGALDISTPIVAALLLVTPVGVLFYVANSQYLEVVDLLLLAVVSHVLWSRPSKRAAAAVLVAGCVASTLVHELALLSTVPVMLVVFYLQYAAAERDGATLGFVAATYAACVMSIIAIGARPADTIAAMAQYIATRVDFSTAADDLSPLTLGMGANLRHAMGEYVQPPGGSRVVLSLVTALPAMAFLARATIEKLKVGVGAVVAAVGFLPFGLIAIADDVFRWYVLTVAGLAVLCLTPASGIFARPDRTPDGSRKQENRLTAAIGLVALVVAFVLPYPYFGADANVGYPAPEGVRTLARFVRTMGWF